ncbi:F-box/kelch-repeat protein At1g51550 [Linum perenne]
MASSFFTNNGPSSSSFSSSSSSPIFNMASDHLFTILHLLPVESILSFSTTCKKFRSLATSDSLWQSVCTREFGTSSVDALIRSSLLPNSTSNRWMSLYRQVSRLDSVSCIRLVPDPDAQLGIPSPRASHSLNFISDCLVLFGGGCEGGRHLDETWITYVGSNSQTTSKWQKVCAGIPSGRFGHTSVAIGNYVILFGGINDRGDRHNDTWVGQVVPTEKTGGGGGITLSWRLLDVVGTKAPPPRGAHAACCFERKMVIQGGIGLYGLRLGDTWVLDLSEDFCSGTWYELSTHPAPPPRSGHTLTCIGGTKMVLFGGRGLGYEVMDDVWLLQVSEGDLRWVQIVYEVSKVPQGVSLRRVGHSATMILGGRLLIYGGEDSLRHRKDDFLILDISAFTSPVKEQPTTTLNPKRTEAASTDMWRKIKEKGDKPNRRSFHRACADQSGRYLYVFGGMVDGLLQPGEAAGLRFDGELFVVELFQ